MRLFFIDILPFSGVNRPKIHLIRTDFPVPEPPIITEDVPSSISRFTPFKTFLFSKYLCKFS